MDHLINAILEQIINDIENDIKQNQWVHKVLANNKICFYVFANKKYHWLMNYLLINNKTPAYEYELLTKEDFIKRVGRGLRQ